MSHDFDATRLSLLLTICGYPLSNRSGQPSPSAPTRRAGPQHA